MYRTDLKDLYIVTCICKELPFRGLNKILVALIFRPNHSSTYVDAAYCYQLSSLVCRSVTLVSPAKTAGPIEMPFGLRTRVGPWNHVLDGGPGPPTGRGNFEGEDPGAAHSKV